MGLIAREIEARGIPTLCMSSGRSITRSVHPPRAVFLDFPLGHTAGKAGETELNAAIMRDTLAAFEAIREPGEIVTLDYEWAEDDSWKDAVMRPSRKGEPARDERVERLAEPQYQSAEDRVAAEQPHRQEPLLVLRERAQEKPRHERSIDLQGLGLYQALSHDYWPPEYRSLRCPGSPRGDGFDSPRVADRHAMIKRISEYRKSF